MGVRDSYPSLSRILRSREWTRGDLSLAVVEKLHPRRQERSPNSASKGDLRTAVSDGYGTTGL
jgi:hypothetical protein